MTHTLRHSTETAIIRNAIIAALLWASSPSAWAVESWTLSDGKINVLRAGDVCEMIGLKEWVAERKRLGVQNWTKPEQIFSWPVKAADSGSCEVTLLLMTPKPGMVMILSSNKDRVEIKIPEAGWQRIPANLKVDTDDTIRLQLQDELPGGPQGTAEIISLEVITPKHLPIHKARLAEICTPVAEAQWFQNAGFGLMFQWGSWGYPQTGEKKQPWNKIYEDFDIEAFANKMKSINPGYIVWSVTWRGSRFSSPLKSVEAIMRSNDYTMEYDFLGKLTDALTKRGIPVLFYYHPGAEEPSYWNKVWHGHDDVKAWEDANVAIWTEIGERYGDKLSGWFVDDGMAQYYPSDFYRYIKALKAGNSKRIISFNPWIFPKVSPYDEMAMGEGHCPGNIEDGRLVSGPNKGLMPHTMVIMDGPDWGVWQPNTKIQPPNGSVERFQATIDHAKKDKHPISLTILMYEDGALGEETETILKQLKR